MLSPSRTSIVDIRVHARYIGIKADKKKSTPAGIEYMNTEKARIAKVQIGNQEVEGILMPDGTFGITAQQTSALFGLAPDHATRDIKRLLGSTSGLAQVAIAEQETGKKQNLIFLPQFEKVLFELALKGNKEAIEFARMMVGLSLTQLWSDAFGIKFEQQQRTQYVACRQEHQKQFHQRLTPFWKEDGCEGKDYQKRVVAFKKAVCLPPYKSVDEYTEEELRLLNAMEIEYKAYRKCGLNHQDALDKLTI